MWTEREDLRTNCVIWVSQLRCVNAGHASERLLHAAAFTPKVSEEKLSANVCDSLKIIAKLLIGENDRGTFR